MRSCLFILSVDTEEEWDWEGPFPHDEISVENIQKLPKFQKSMAEIGIKPTYFLDYAVIENDDSRAVLQNLLAEYPDIEYGAHLHPWVTPPASATLSEEESHIVNLPIDLVRQQLDTLVSAIETNFGRAPTSFRSGRWGINDNILNYLIEKGFTVDSSVYPYYKNKWFSCEDDTSVPTWKTPNTHAPDKKIFELPVTVGFNRKDYAASNKWFKTLEQAPLKYAHPIGLLWKTNLLKKIYLSPELSNSNDMIQLCQTALENDYPVIHMYMHSSSLLPGISQYVKTRGDKEKLIHRIERVLNYLNTHCDVRVCTISEAADTLTAKGPF